MYHLHPNVPASLGQLQSLEQENSSRVEANKEIILAMSLCRWKRETFKIAFRQNSPHKLRTPYLTTITLVTRIMKLCLLPLTLTHTMLQFHAPNPSTLNQKQTRSIRFPFPFPINFASPNPSIPRARTCQSNKRKSSTAHPARYATARRMLYDVAVFKR